MKNGDFHSYVKLPPLHALSLATAQLRALRGLRPIASQLFIGPSLLVTSALIRES